MNRVLVTGSNGQLGSAIRKLALSHPAFEMQYADIDQLDLTNKEAVFSFFEKGKFDFIVNCAAYTAVDKAEDEPDLCDLVNRKAIRNIGEAATTFGMRVIHISTDYVFDGTNYKPYIETDPTNPVSVYGKTKLAGEKALLVVCPGSVIIRTAWLYSEVGNNFVKTMIRLGKERDNLNVVFDQIGTPTYASDLASAIFTILESKTFIPGIYHFSNEGVCSWYDFAIKIHQLAGITCEINPVETKDYPTKAVRPHYSVLNKFKIKNTYQLVIPHWETSLKKMISHLTN